MFEHRPSPRAITLKTEKNQPGLSAIDPSGGEKNKPEKKKKKHPKKPTESKVWTHLLSQRLTRAPSRGFLRTMPVGSAARQWGLSVKYYFHPPTHTRTHAHTRAHTRTHAGLGIKRADLSSYLPASHGPCAFAHSRRQGQERRRF